MSFAPKIRFHTGIDENGSFTSMVVVWYQRVTQDAILQEVTEALRDGVKQHFAQDEEFRNRVRSAIEQAAMAMPIEAIVEGVKSAIQSLKTEDISQIGAIQAWKDKNQPPSA